MSKYTDVTYLKSLKIAPHYFGLGFIQLKLSERTRMHFWHPELSAITPPEEMHNHRYNFTSQILRGSLINETYGFLTVDKGISDFEKVSVSCKPNSAEEFIYIEDVLPYMLASHKMVEGTIYSMKADTYHRIHASHAVTFLQREEVVKNTAQVIRDRTNPFVCPFSVSKNEKELWEMMDECLRGFPRSYHATEIAKGEIGELSKLQEELDELADAVKQKNSIMALIELSDLYGAIELYLKKHHPSTTMSDLASMSTATQRAFVNGFRK